MNMDYEATFETVLYDSRSLKEKHMSRRDKISPTEILQNRRVSIVTHIRDWKSAIDESQEVIDEANKAISELKNDLEVLDKAIARLSDGV